MDTNIPAAVDQAINDAQELVTKGVTTSDLSTATYTADSLIQPQDLSPLITDLSQKETSFYNRVRKTRGVGAAALFNLKESVYKSGENASAYEYLYAEGGLPVERNTQYGNIVNPYKDLGTKGSVTGRAIRQMQGGTTDLMADAVESAMMRLRFAIDWASFWFRSDTTSTGGISGYQGFDQLITTNIVDAAGAQISKALIDKLARKIYYSGGAGMVDSVWCSAGVGIDINNLYNPNNQLSVNLGPTNGLTFGNRIGTLATIVGDLDVVPNYFINPGTPFLQGSGYSASSGPAGVGTSTVFFLGMRFIEYRELLPMSKVDLAIVADKQDFMVIESGSVVLRAEPFMGKITNVAESSYVV